MQGRQQPRVSSVPPCVSSTGREAVELAEAAGLYLDPWEKLVLSESLGERADGQWSAFEVGLIVPRQNGKGSILEARELAGLFLLDERLIIHAAHQFDTSLEHFRRLKELVEGSEEFSSRVKSIKQSHGDEGIELMNGQRIRFRTRTKGGGRGFTGDLVVFDEAMEFAESAHGAILPSLAARSIYGNPQVWYVGSAVDQWIHDNGVVFARVRERGHAGTDPALAFFEWSAACDDPDEVGVRALDQSEWATANPGLGIRISAEHIEREQRSMDPRTFAVERLGVGDWPRTDGAEHQVIDQQVWAGLLDDDSRAVGPRCLVFDVAPDRASASIAISGKREDGEGHLEIVASDRGTGWVVPQIVELLAEQDITEVACDGVGPAASLLPLLAELNIEVTTLSAKEHAQACGTFYDACEQGSFRRRASVALDAAIQGARQRPLGDAWAWSRKSSSIDISPLVSVTIALWKAAQGIGESVYNTGDLLVLD